jgi:hypothetical protein
MSDDSQMPLMEETPEQTITLEAFEHLTKVMCEQKAKVDAIREMDKEETGKLESLKMKVMGYLEQFGKDKYPVTGYGTISIQERFYAKIPADPEKKRLFMLYLKERGVYEGMVSVNANTLNSFVNKELEAAKETGNFEFAIPGIEDFGNYKILSIRAK